MKDSVTLKTIKEIKIMSNPIRMKVLKNYYTIGKPATVKQMAVHMGEVPANIHYHVKKLIEINVLELHHTQNVNGIIAKFYIPTAKSIKIEDEENEDHFINEKEIIVSNIFDECKQEFMKSMRALSEQEENCTLVSKELSLSRAEYLEVIDVIRSISERTENADLDTQKKYLFFSGIIEKENE